MNVWHQTDDAKRCVVFEDGAWWIYIEIGTWPIEPGQSVRVRCSVTKASAVAQADLSCDAAWGYNSGPNSYWHVKMGPFAIGDCVEYLVVGQSAGKETTSGQYEIRIGPRIFLAFLWHQHQPLYKDCLCPKNGGRFLFPWVRLHCLRDYYSMAALIAQHPNIRVTINLTPVLLRQIEDYVEHGG